MFLNVIFGVAALMSLGIRKVPRIPVAAEESLDNRPV